MATLLEKMWRDGTLVGAEVEVYGRRAVIKALYGEDVPGGVMLDREIKGFTSWNIDELTLVQQAEGAESRAQ